jgi:hypothetical protein
VDPTSKLLRANGDKAGSIGRLFRRSKAKSRPWYDAKTLDEEKAIARQLNKVALDNSSMRRLAGT